ncbi:MAG TPA: hypothetical protein VF116_16235 [Ktedonobacterales bacterium]
MSEIRDHELVQWLIMGLSVVAFIVALKAGISYLPDKVPGAKAVKSVVMAV